ncbi:uncharacterized protein LOC125179545 [Hyalella azteca]|uniref:Uncharacterized protein LOC125179545 n=1 Tax=Hyalella azteca TaxID=294128 RepID=A0A979FY74_HYAAZ|nr:uncharacterized protein LOC125179545 [Hyalella azteca]
MTTSSPISSADYEADEDFKWCLDSRRASDCPDNPESKRQPKVEAHAPKESNLSIVQISDPENEVKTRNITQASSDFAVKSTTSKVLTASTVPNEELIKRISSPSEPNTPEEIYATTRFADILISSHDMISGNFAHDPNSDSETKETHIKQPSYPGIELTQSDRRVNEKTTTTRSSNDVVNFEKDEDVVSFSQKDCSFMSPFSYCLLSEVFDSSETHLPPCVSRSENAPLRKETNELTTSGSLTDQAGAVPTRMALPTIRLNAHTFEGYAPDYDYRMEEESSSDGARINGCNEDKFVKNSEMNRTETMAEAALAEENSVQAHSVPVNAAIWTSDDIENFLINNNFEENMRLGFISSEDIDIYEWKRTTGMSPICDTDWTRATLRRNKAFFRDESRGSFPLPDVGRATPDVNRAGQGAVSATCDQPRASQRQGKTPPVRPARSKQRKTKQTTTSGETIHVMEIECTSDHGGDFADSDSAAEDVLQDVLRPPPQPKMASKRPSSKLTGHLAFRGFKLCKGAEGGSKPTVASDVGLSKPQPANCKSVF